MITKYNDDFPNDVIDTNINRLTNQIWKLIPMWEHNEDWEKQLSMVIIQVRGLKEIFISYPHFLELLFNLEGLRPQENLQDIEFDAYRKTVFSCITLLQGLKDEYTK